MIFSLKLCDHCLLLVTVWNKVMLPLFNTLLFEMGRIVTVSLPGGAAYDFVSLSVLGNIFIRIGQNKCWQVLQIVNHYVTILYENGFICSLGCRWWCLWWCLVFCCLFSHEMSWIRSGSELSQFLRIFPTYSCDWIKLLYFSKLVEVSITNSKRHRRKASFSEDFKRNICCIFSLL